VQSLRWLREWDGDPCPHPEKPENKLAAPLERRVGALLLMLDAGGGDFEGEGGVALGVGVGSNALSL